MLTRHQYRSVARQPPPLRRTSALAAVRFTSKGRRMARRMMIPDRDARMYYWCTSSAMHAEVTHHFDTSAGTFAVIGRVVPEFEILPLREEA